MRLIDADLLKGRFIHGRFDDVYISEKEIQDAPTVDAVQVVRCWQCSHSEVCKMDDGDVRYCHIYEMQTEYDYYCADGERKNDTLD